MKPYPVARPNWQLLIVTTLLLLVPAARSQVQLNVATGTIGLDYVLLQSAVDRFMVANPDVSVRLLYTPELTDDRLTLLRNFFEVGSPELDVLQLDIVWTDELAAHLRDLTSLTATAGDIDSRLLEAATVDGRLVSMPWFTSLGVLFYRSDLLAAYGFDAPPTTWAELDMMARTIQAGERAAGNSDFWGYVWQGNDYEGLSVNAIEWFGSSGAGTVIDEPGVISIANVSAEIMLSRVRGWIGDISPPDVLEFTENDTFTTFVHGKAAFMRGWPNDHAVLHESPRLAGRYGVALLPTGEGSGRQQTGVLGGEGLAVSRYSLHPDEARRLVAFLVSEQEQRLAATDGARIPTRPGLYADSQVISAMPFLPHLLPGLAAAIRRPVHHSDGLWSGVSRSLYSTVHRLLSGSTEPGPELWQLAQGLQFFIGLPTGEPR